MILRVSTILFVVLFLSTASAQWRELALPPGTYVLTAAGNPSQPGAIAIWTQKRPVVDSTLAITFIPSTFYVSSNGGATWTPIDSSIFRRIDTPPLMYYDEPFEVQYVGDEITRTVFTQEGIDQIGYYFERKKGSGAFAKRAFPHPVNQDEGTPWLHLTDRDLLFNVYLRLYEPDDSTTFALYQSTDGGAGWGIQPDSVAGLIRMARATCLGYRLKFPADIYMGTVDGLYRSPNGGIAWDFFPTYTDIDSMSIRKVVVHPGEPSLMYVVGYNPNGADMRDKVFRSLDYGYHWDLVFADTLVTDIATSIADARFALVNASSGLQFTSDKGVTWTNVQKNLPPQGEPYRVQWIHLDAGNPRRAAVSFVSKIYVNDDLTAVEIPPSQVTGLSIGACYPSPFALGGKLDLTAEYSAPRPGTPILFRLYDILGRVVWQGEEQNPVEGYNVMTIGRDRLASLPAGMYLLTGTADGISSSRKILLFP